MVGLPTPRFFLSILTALVSVHSTVALDEATCGAACDNYGSELQTVYNMYSQNAQYIGQPMNSADGAIRSMCDITGTAIETCHQCSDTTNDGLTGAGRQLMDAWWETCVTYQGSGQDTNTAYSCWSSIPQGSGQCSSVAQSLGGSSNGAAATRSSIAVAVLAAVAAVMVG